MRDKLIELIKSRRDPCDIGACPFTVDDVRPCSLCEAESLAEHLIANGVTFADVPETNVGKWIPVSERLPEFYMNEDGCYCTHGKLVFRSGWDKTVHIGYCIKLIYIISVETLETIETLEWYDDGGHKWENITHWLPLPPKDGEA